MPLLNKFYGIIKTISVNSERIIKSEILTCIEQWFMLLTFDII